MSNSTRNLETTMATSPKPHNRAGHACEQCRRRKLRCDRSQPKCGLCEASNLECEITARPPRGPKRGYLKVLEDRVGERLLLDRVL